MGTETGLMWIKGSAVSISLVKLNNPSDGDGNFLSNLGL